jgi:protein-disulfide isomerase
MRLNPTTIAAAAVSSLVTLCATAAVVTIANHVSREQGLSDVQRTEIARLVKDQVGDIDERVNKAVREQGLSEAQRAEVTRVIKENFRSNPEIMQEILAELIKKRVPAAGAPSAAATVPINTDKSALVKSNAPALFASARQVTLGNPQGDVTMVEFFDYNCGYCKRALADMVDLMKADPKLKVVLKEFPVLGQGSLEAAQVAVAVRMQDRTGEKYLEFHQKLLSDRGPANRVRALAVAKDIGLDMTRLESDLATDEVRASIEESAKLARTLGINGTPSYVIGENVVVGAVGIAALGDKVRAVRK